MWVSLQKCALLVTLQVMIGSLLMVSQVDSCYLSRQSSVGQRICSFVLDGYDIELISPKDDFRLQQGDLILARNTLLKDEMVESVDLRLHISGGDCQWETNVPLQVVRQKDHVEGNQSYHLWPECPHLQQRRRSKREVTLQETSITVSENTTVGTVVYTVQISQPPSSGPYMFALEGADLKFEIDEILGTLTLTRRLDSEVDPIERFIVVISNADIGDITREEFTVFVTSQAVLTWTMRAYPYLAVVPADAPNDACIYQLNAVAEEEAEINYFLRTSSDLSDGSPTDRFRVDQTSGCVFTVVTDSSPEFTTDDEFILSVYAVDVSTVGNDRLELDAEVRVFGVAHPPQFTQEMYQAFVEEEVSGPQTVIQVQAYSFNIKLAVTYSLNSCPSPCPDHSIDSETGLITLITGNLDREQLASYFVTVNARENSDGGLISTVRVNVAIVDKNDCTPEFVGMSNLYRKVPETSTEIFELPITDCDVGPNAQLNYTLTGSGAPYFYVTDEGYLYSYGNLDFDRIIPPRYTFAIEASDMGIPSLSSSIDVIVEVSPEDDEVPEFVPGQYSYIIDETFEAAGGIDIGAVYANDPDRPPAAGPSLFYRIDGSSPSFDVNRDTGVLLFTPAVPLAESSYSVTVIATSDGEEVTTTFDVTLNDINNHAPEFTNCADANISEAAQRNEPVIEVTATDEDSGQNGLVTYSLEPGNSPFRIDSNTGLITVSQPSKLDRENIPFYLMTVIARDKSQKVPQLQGFCTLTISLTDVNDETPQFGLTGSDYRTAIPKSFVSSDPVLVVAAEDPDLGTELTYTLDDSMYFRITPDTGEIFARPDLENAPNLVTLTVTANDSAQWDSIDIQIQFIEGEYFQAPTWIPYCEDGGEGCCNVDETVPQGEQVLDVQAFSRSSDPSIIYSLLRGARPETNSLNSFTLRSIDNFTKADILVGAGELDYETVSRITLEISAKNKGQNSLQDTTLITFCIVDRNDNPPTFLQDNYDAFVSESAPADTLVITVTAGDLDASEEFREQRYSIVPDELDSNEFTINETTGEIRNSRQFDREQNKEVFIINVIARNVIELADGGVNEAQATVSIYVLDENDFEPFFRDSSYQVSISGYAEIGEELITLTAIDEDADSQLQYFISNGNTEGTFTVNHMTGRITVARRIPESVSFFTLTYNVNDGLASNQTTIDVTVDPSMEPWPQFDADDDSYTGEVTENTEPPSEIVIVNISPAGESYTYSLLSETSPFEIDSVTGAITSTSDLDREVVPVWYLVARATKDSQIEDAYAGVTINVIDENDSAPDYPLMEYVDTVDEVVTADSSVMSMKAEDGDSDFQLSYTIDCLSPSDPCVFDIDETSGDISYNGDSDLLDPGNFYEVLVTATDEGNEASATATIYVKDVDNDFPTFPDDDPVSFTVGNDAAIGDTVGVLPVEDADEDFRDSVQFSIIDGNTDGYFDIYSDPYTLQGVIVVAKELNEPDGGTIAFTVQVTDQDFIGTPLTETVSVSVTVETVEEPPKFIGDYPPELSVLENTQVILTLEIIDDESDTFSVSVFPDEEFAIAEFQPNFYQLLTKNENGLDRETRDGYEVVVTATEDKQGGLSSSMTIKITVEDVDDEAPYFEYNPVAVVDPEDQGEQLVVELRATDDDLESSEPGYLQYELLNFNDIFTLVPNTQDNSASVIKNSGESQDYNNMELSVAVTDKAGNEATFQIPVEEYSNIVAHTPASKTITVYSFEGNIPTSPIGTVPVEDEDPFEDKNYEFIDSQEYFLLDSDTGLLTIESGTPAGTYNLEVTVTDDGIRSENTFPDVDSSIEVIVKYVSREAVVNSGSIRFSSPGAQMFASPVMRETLQERLAGALGVEFSNVDIFSIIPSPGGSGTDVRYSVSRTTNRRRRSVRQLLAISDAFYTAEYIDVEVLGQLESDDWTVDMVSIDECIPNDCIRECSSVLTIEETPVVVNTPEFSFVSVNSYEVAECSCAVKSTPIGGCLSTTCRNGGTCISLDSGDVGYTCSCPAGFEGPECQRLAATFDGQQYAWLEALSQCEESHTSLEFLTSSQSGVLFYNGPLFDDQDTTDYMLLQLVNGILQLKVNFGGGETILEIGSSSLDDNTWHKVDIFRSGTSIDMVLDSCGNDEITITEDFNLSELSPSAGCRDSGILQGSFPIFECNRPLQLGGVADPIPTSTSFVGANFNGCIKNLIDNGKLYDLEVNDAGSQNPPVGGCASADSGCFMENGRPYCVNGVCDTSSSEVSCVCHAGWSGTRCNSALSEYDFAEESYVLYDLSSVGDIDRSVSDYHVSIRTRQKEDALIWTIANENTYEHITLEMVNGYLQASWHLGDTTVYDSLPNYPLNNGEWHAISFQRKNNFVTVKVDGGGGVREFSNQESQFRMLDVDRMSLKVGAMVVREVVVSKNLLGCGEDVRFNGRSLGLTDSGDAVRYSQGVTLGCSSLDPCNPNPCNGTYQCFDVWREYECRLPITCGDEPCRNGGTCIDVNPVGFECQCPDGFTGLTCEVISEPINPPSLELSPGAIIAIIICLLFLIILLLMLVVCKRRVDDKYNRKILSVDYDSTEDFTAYDEEGEEGDTNAYDLSVLVKPEEDRYRNPEEETEVVIRPVEEPLVDAERITPARTAVTFQPNVGDYLIDRIDEEDNKSENGPKDETLDFHYEGDGSSAGSISSLNSSSTGASEQDFSYLQDFGPPFKRLADIYGSEEREPSVRLSFSSTDA